jgi:GxxExxY protein
LFVRTPLLLEDLTYSVIGCGIEVHREFGYGFLELHYVMALERELLAKGHTVSREFAVMVNYKGQELSWLRLDMVVDGKLVVEVKSARKLPPEASRQLYNYLKATHLQVGLLLHFSPEGLKYYRQIHTLDRKPSVISARSVDSNDPGAEGPGPRSSGRAADPNSALRSD